MRTLKLAAITVIVLSVLAGIYVMSQPNTPRAPTGIDEAIARPGAAPRPAASEPATSSSQTIVKAGEDVWIKVPDQKTGQLSWQMRTTRYDPQPDNSVNVQEPQAEFYFDNGQRIIRIEGTHGRVVVPGDLSSASRINTAAAAPSRGELYNVTISVFVDGNTTRPWAVCRVNNAAFDNDTFRIATESFTKPDGTVVPADQVPVEVRGDDYDFDGRGLTIRWNERDRRLQLLEIAHGESLTVKSDKGLRGFSQSPDAAPARPRVAHAAPEPGRAVLAAGVITTTEQPAKSPQPVYRASFEGGTRVTQGDKQIAAADFLHVDFMLGDEEPAADAKAAAPTSRSANPSSRKPPATKPAHASPSKPQEPIVVRWPGRLVVVPLLDDVPQLKPGQRNVEMASTDTPVVLNYAGAEIKCGSFVYGSDDTVVVRSSSAVPTILLKDADGVVLHTSLFRYSGAARLAVLEGQSQAEIPLRNEQTGTSDLLTTAWNKTCTLELTGDSLERFAFDRAVLSGDVRIEHPRLKLSSSELDLALAPGSNGRSPQLRTLDARGAVLCELRDDQQRQQNIRSERLKVEADPAGASKFAIGTVTADGGVRAWDAEQELQAGHLVATLEPTTRPSDSPRIATILAQQDVRFNSKQISGRADQLTATQAEDDYDVRLQGQPSASVGTPEAMLHGPIIHLQPGRQTAQVVGAGSLSGQRQASPNSRPTPYEFTWRDQLMINGATNHGELTGGVAMHSTAEDGSRNSVTGDRLLLTLADDPAARRRAATAPAGGLIGSVDTMSGKIVQQVTLEGDTQVQSVLNDASGNLLRRAHLFAPKIIVQAEDQRVVVPSAGRLLYEDLQTPARATTVPATPLGDFTGATAFEWKQSLTFDQSKNRAEMLGDVVIVHQRDEAKADPFRLEAPRVLAEFEREKGATSRPADATLTPMASAARVRVLSAEGGARFVSPKIQFDADRMTYDAAKEVLAAIGSENAPVQLYDEKGMPAGTVQEAWWNTRTQSIGLRDVQAQIRR